MTRIWLRIVGASILIFWLLTGAVLVLGRVLPTKQLAYITDGYYSSTLVLLDFYHRIPINLMAHVFSPSWSPSGEQIVFYLSEDSSVSGLYILDVFSHHIQLLNKYGTYVSSPSWSPDGHEIAFISGYDNVGGIFVMPIDCKDTIKSCATLLTPNDGFYGYTSPMWSPDGNYIAFVSTRDSVNNNNNIFVMNRDGSQLRRLTENPGDDTDPSWSPDSRHIVYSAHSLELGTNALMMIDTECSAEISCTYPIIGDNWEMMPDWSPDGNSIVFVDAIGDKFELYVTDTEGHYLQRLTYNDIQEINPRWRP